jgi:hypothetical protein
MFDDSSNADWWKGEEQPNNSQVMKEIEFPTKWFSNKLGRMKKKKPPTPEIIPIKSRFEILDL